MDGGAHGLGGGIYSAAHAPFGLTGGDHERGAVERLRGNAPGLFFGDSGVAAALEVMISQVRVRLGFGEQNRLGNFVFAKVMGCGEDARVAAFGEDDPFRVGAGLRLETGKKRKVVHCL